MQQQTTTVPRRRSVPEMRVLVDFLALFAKGVAAGVAACFALGAIVLLFSSAAGAADELMRPADAGSGSLLVATQQQGHYRRLPLLDTAVEMKVAGMVVRARVTQRFSNPDGEWLEGIYVFPLPESAAVDRLKMRIGERVIEGRIKERAAARLSYEKARREGRRTSLLEQERANIFTSSVANIGPGEQVTVEIEYQQALRYDQGAFRLRFPLVVAPRYVPGNTHVAGVAGSGWSPNTDIVSDAARITPPVLRPRHEKHNPVSLRIELDSGFPLAGLTSAHHRVDIAAGRGGAQVVTLSEGSVAADRDFELAWTPAPGRSPQAAVFSEQRGGRTYALLMLMPPVQAQAAGERMAREVVFVIDTSGSMAGISIEQAREALLLALDRLGPADRFNVIEFNSRVGAVFDAARAADAQSLQRARDFVRGLRAQGGTEMAAALDAALTSSDDPRLLRQVIFLTDGAVGNEDQLLRMIHHRLGDSRLFTVGIGSAPNGHFMTKAAQFGRGSFTHIGDLGEVRRKMGELFAKLENPLLSDIRVHWPAGAAVEAWPQRVPDLYLGEPVVLSAAFEGAVDRVVVTGRRGSEPWQAVLPLEGAPARAGMGTLWARHKIAALMDQLRSGDERETEPLRAAIVTLALEHRLVSRYTSLVAVDTTPARPADMPLHAAAVPANLPHGWNYDSVFGELPQTATGGPLHVLAGLILLLLAGLLWLAHKRGMVRAGS